MSIPATRSQLAAEIRTLGVRPGDLLMVHASLRAVGGVRGGAAVVVQALQDAVSATGTLAAYVDFEPFFEEEDEVEVPVFDKRTACAARDHGVLHEVMRTWPGALRSDHPDAGVVGIGPLAEWLTRDHPLQYGYGPGSPLEKIVQANGRILMLGAPLDTLTVLHYAEHCANIPGKRIRHYRRLLPGQNGPAWVDLEEFDTSEPVNDQLPADCFEQIGQAFAAAGHGSRGKVGQADSYLLEARPLVEFGIQWLERYFSR